MSDGSSLRTGTAADPGPGSGNPTLPPAAEVSRPSLKLRRWHPGTIVGWARGSHFTGDVLWSEGVRAMLCLLPMVVADLLDKRSYIAPLGQAGFFVSAMFLPRVVGERINLMLIWFTVGGGFYLLGGNVVDTPWLALTFMIAVGVVVSYMTAWQYGAMLALALTILFCTGINSGSPERAATNFKLYAFAALWGGAIALLPIWRSPPGQTNRGVSEVPYAEQGVRIGLGSAVALGTAYLFGFAKLGWAPSAVGSVVRFDHDLSRRKAVGRAAGVIAGGGLALAIMLVFDRTRVFVLIAVLFAVLNSLFKATEVGGFPIVSVPFLHTVALLLMLSADRPEVGPGLALARIGTNELGIIIGLFVVFYPLPLIMRLTRRVHAPPEPGGQDRGGDDVETQEPAAGKS